MLGETSCEQSSQAVQPTLSRTSTFIEYDDDDLFTRGTLIAYAQNVSSLHYLTIMISTLGFIPPPG